MAAPLLALVLLPAPVPGLAQVLRCDTPHAAPAGTPADDTEPASTSPQQQRLAQRFRLAADHCSAGLLQASPPHEAQQLRLYQPAGVGVSGEGGVAARSGLPVASAAVAAVPMAAAVPVPAPRASSRAGAPGPRSGAAVQRIRALVPTVADAAQRHDVDPLLLHAVAHVESRHNAGATSHAGARGVMQVMPATGRRFGVADPMRQLHDPDINVHVGAEYLKVLQKRFGNNLPLVLAAYNAGEGSVEKYGRRIPPYPETQAYVREVLATYERLRQAVRGDAAGRATR